ncbi:MAG: type II toxin-antitoxin system VapC family toxin [Kiritimatiellae bacterium]|jgi:PIN domain nuclease of toxin-antitoxin system|nr:type II toxin-antitoxin system VapC family toxin [Kiritimatiellia bacterium]
MELILDTCGLLSLAGLADRPLSQGTLNRVRKARGVGLSACSAFEIAIKHKKGALPLGRFSTPDLFWREAIMAYDLEEIPVTSALFFSSIRLPGYHADPFDRLIVATALHAEAAVITFDRLLNLYSVECLD